MYRVLIRVLEYIICSDCLFVRNCLQGMCWDETIHICNGVCFPHRMTLGIHIYEILHAWARKLFRTMTIAQILMMNIVFALCKHYIIQVVHCNLATIDICEIVWVTKTLNGISSYIFNMLWVFHLISNFPLWRIGWLSFSPSIFYITYNFKTLFFVFLWYIFPKPNRSWDTENQWLVI